MMVRLLPAILLRITVAYSKKIGRVFPTSRAEIEVYNKPGNNKIQFFFYLRAPTAIMKTPACTFTQLWCVLIVFNIQTSHRIPHFGRGRKTPYGISSKNRVTLYVPREIKIFRGLKLRIDRDKLPVCQLNTQRRSGASKHLRQWNSREQSEQVKLFLTGSRYFKSYQND